jgi:hypothetical protein
VSSSQQEANLLTSLTTAEEGNLEGNLEQALLESGESGQIKSAVDTTLDEIKRLRIIDRELAKSQGPNSY